MLSELPLSEQIACELRHAEILAARARAALNPLDPPTTPPAFHSPGAAVAVPLSAGGGSIFSNQQDHA